MEEFKAKSHAVKKMTRKGLVETDSREGIVKETAEAKSDGRRINEADFQLERKGAQSRADPVDDKPVSDVASRRKKQMVQKGVRDGNGFDEAVVNDCGIAGQVGDKVLDGLNLVGVSAVRRVQHPRRAFHAVFAIRNIAR